MISKNKELVAEEKLKGSIIWIIRWLKKNYKKAICVNLKGIWKNKKNYRFKDLITIKIWEGQKKTNNRKNCQAHKIKINQSNNKFKLS
jgi:hypothetical protein